MDQQQLDALVWDLVPVSKEEFQSRLDQVNHYDATMDLDTDDADIFTHYTDQDGLYLGSIKITDDGAEYLVADECSE